jgi:hypothetical protein
MGFLDENKGNCVKQPTTCIIWVGGKVCGINVCEGESLESVIKKIGKALNSLESSIDIQDLDYSCLLGEKECSPKDLKELIQLIINKQCSTSTTEISNNIDITVVPASCFQETLGNEAISIVTYMEFLGETVCNQNIEISNLKESLSQLRERMNDLESQVQRLIGG